MFIFPYFPSSDCKYRFCTPSTWKDEKVIMGPWEYHGRIPNKPSARESRWHLENEMAPESLPSGYPFPSINGAAWGAPWGPWMFHWGWSYWCWTQGMDGNGWEWVNGMTIQSDYGSFPHSLQILYGQQHPNILGDLAASVLLTWRRWAEDGLSHQNSRERDSFLNPPSICKLYINMNKSIKS